VLASVETTVAAAQAQARVLSATIGEKPEISSPPAAPAPTDEEKPADEEDNTSPLPWAPPASAALDKEIAIGTHGLVFRRPNARPSPRRDSAVVQFIGGPGGDTPPEEDPVPKAPLPPPPTPTTLADEAGMPAEQLSSFLVRDVATLVLALESRTGELQQCLNEESSTLKAALREAR
jgi:hypothetical protein